MAAPPEQPSGCGVAVIFLLTLAFAFLCLVNFGCPVLWLFAIITVLMAIASFLLILNYRAQLRQYPYRRKTWLESWRCLQCGHSFSDPRFNQVKA